jgi:hypothetical protein
LGDGGGNLKGLIKFQLEKHVPGEVEIGPSLHHDRGQTEGSSGSTTVEGASSSAEGGTENGSLHAPLANDRKAGTVSSVTFQRLLTILRGFDVSVASSNNADFQRKNGPVGQANIIKPESHFGPASQSTGSPNMGHGGTNLASPGYGNITAHYDLIGSLEIGAVAVASGSRM